MHVAQQLLRMVFLLDYLRLEAALEVMPGAAPPAVEANRECRLEPPHCRTEIRRRCREYQMIVVAHEAIAMHHHSESLRHLRESRQPELPVHVPCDIVRRSLPLAITW